MGCVIGLCQLMSNPNMANSADLEENDEDADQNILSSDEDEIDEEGAMYLESLQEKINKSTNGNLSGLSTSIEDDEDSDEDDDDEFDYEDETSLESFVTPLDDEDTAPDEYQIFRSVVQEIQ